MRHVDLRMANDIVGLFVDTQDYDHQTTDDLVTMATDTNDSAIRWACIRVLQERGGPHVFNDAVTLCGSAEPRDRELGIALLGQNLVADKSFRTLALPLLRAAAADERDPGVLVTLCGALSDGEGGGALDAFSRWASHPDAAVRAGVAQGVRGCDDERAVVVLIALMTDQEATVRDWATFGLGTQTDADSPVIRAALVGRLTDPHADVRSEAIAGLARRGDQRVMEPLLRELQSEVVGSVVIEAARDIADPRLHPALVRLQEWWDVDTALLNEAIVRCQASRA